MLFVGRIDRPKHTTDAERTPGRVRGATGRVEVRVLAGGIRREGALARADPSLLAALK